MKLEHHYTLTLTCQAPDPWRNMNANLSVMTVSGDYTTVREALAEAMTSEGSALAQLDRFERTLSAPESRHGTDL